MKAGARYILNYIFS